MLVIINKLYTCIKSSINEFSKTKSSFTEVGTLDTSKPISVYVICFPFKSNSGDFNNFNRPECNKIGVA